jgi:hypothetical protein
MKIEKSDVYGILASIRACRNPMNSWAKSDTYISWESGSNFEFSVLGEADMKLSQKLTKAGSSHCKHLRLVTVWFDVTAPRYWYTEFDTYKHKENVSCSTMHKITSRELTVDDFEEGVDPETIEKLNELIREYQQTKSDETFLQIKNNLPEGYLQKRTVCTNYQTLLSMYNQRKNHRLPQWKVFCDWILTLPYFKELTGVEA